MRIESLSMSNYRQFSNVEVNFNLEGENDLHVVIGKNGTCKTNILNAINWCLYGDEPHFSKESQKLPILNVEAINNTKDGHYCSVSVTVEVKTNAGKYMTFERKAKYKVQKGDGKLPLLQSTEFQVEACDDDDNTKLFSDEEAEKQVERFVPKKIREFFFFDGERLDHYFKEATSQNMRHAIFNISQIDLIERIEKRMTLIFKELRLEAGKQNPLIEKTREALEDYENNAEELTKRIEESTKQICIAKEKVKECEDNLRGMPDVEKLESERRKYLNEREQRKENLKEKTKQKNSILFDYDKIIYFWGPINKVIGIIEDKIKKKELPPNIDSELLNKILISRVCSVCGTKLSDETVQSIADLLKTFRLSKLISVELLTSLSPLKALKDKIEGFKIDIEKVKRDIIQYEKDLAEIEKRLINIDKMLSGYDENKIKQNHLDRKKWESILEKEQQKTGSFKLQLLAFKRKIEELKKELEREMGREEKLKELRKKIEFCQKALVFVEKIKDQIMDRTRKKIELRTKEIFFELLWKKGTFKDVEISESYDLTLIHALGYPCLGSVSAAERELLALSFTLALHEVSGFDSPILIDTPVARIDEEHRENFGNAFIRVSKNKQTILLFNPAEYSQEIRNILDDNCSCRFVSKLMSNEFETTLEAL